MRHIPFVLVLQALWKLLPVHGVTHVFTGELGNLPKTFGIAVKAITQGAMNPVRIIVKTILFQNKKPAQNTFLKSD
jgi:hypothetical protein